ncbi:unnamed protein product [Parnassius apollo]|uniref:(apollo) hypothetical protein n=1 Tax=Parnassius apollo TaxID=110799 RepID=A0A8S3XEU5_PARAO|nr:unnamed protein product [Parnassius apollo]
MPFKRTPPRIASSTEPRESPYHGGSEPNISTYKDDSDVGDFSTNMSTRATKRKHDQDFKDELQAFKVDILSTLNSWKDSQENKMETILMSINKLRNEYKELHTSVKFMSSNYDEIREKIASLDKEKQEQLKCIRELENKINLWREIKNDPL